MFKLRLQAAGSYLYEIEGWRQDAYLLLRHRPANMPGRPPSAFTLEPLEVALLRRLLLEGKRLYRAGTSPVIDQHEFFSPPGVVEWLAERLCVGYTTVAGLPDGLALPSVAREAPEPALAWRALAAAEERLSVGALACAQPALGALVDHGSVPDYGGHLQFPLVGEAPDGWFAQPPPKKLAADYPHLRALFAPLPLDPCGHLRLHGFLLAAFHADTLTLPAPLLVADSYTQGVGKTEALAAIGVVLDGEPSSVTPPVGGATDELVAHFARDRLFAALDNLSGPRNWSHPWVASLLTDRNTVARVKYSKLAQNFRGRLLGLSLVYGAATLGRDMLDRTWRVQLHGEARRLDHRPPTYAREHRDALVRECYSAVRRADPAAFIGHTRTRCTEVEAVALAAYCEVFGKPAELDEILAQERRDVNMLGSDAVAILKGLGAPFAEEPRTTGNPPRAPYLEGGTALGFRLTFPNETAILERSTPCP